MLKITITCQEKNIGCTLGFLFMDWYYPIKKTLLKINSIYIITIGDYKYGQNFYHY